MCRGMPSCPWDTCGAGPGRGLVGFLWGSREAQVVEPAGRSEAWCPPPGRTCGQAMGSAALRFLLAAIQAANGRNAVLFAPPSRRAEPVEATDPACSRVRRQDFIWSAFPSR